MQREGETTMKRTAFFRGWILILWIALLLPYATFAAVAGETDLETELQKTAEGIVAWKKREMGVSVQDPLLCGTYLSLAGSTPGDWYPVGLSRLGMEDAYADYLAVLNDTVEKRYQTPQKLDKAKATEWHRITFAVLAAGGNPRKMGTDGSIDLIADGVYDRTDEKGNGILGKQGINGYIFGLLALDTRNYAVPESAHYTRDDLIVQLLQRQHADGGWSLYGASDPDITAMTLQALAPYYHKEKVYEVKDGTRKVRQAVDAALSYLSGAQDADGGYTAWGSPNCESAVQVAVALCALGKDLFTDPAFCKNGNTLWDAILRFRNADGGFLHSTVYDPENPTSIPDRSNSMASEQTLYGIAAILRFLRGERRLYDFRPEQSAALKAQIAAVTAEIAALPADASAKNLQSVYTAYLAIDASERSYVQGYAKLSQLLAAADIPYVAEETDIRSEDDGEETVLFPFTEADQRAADALPSPLTLAQKAEVLRLYYKITNSFDFEKKADYLARLTQAKQQVMAISDEIDAINREILEKLCPFTDLTLSDKSTVDALVARYAALSADDRCYILYAEDLQKAKIRMDTRIRALWIGGIGAVVAIGLTGTVIVRIRRRHNRKAREMAELAAEWEDRP